MKEGGTKIPCPSFPNKRNLRVLEPTGAYWTSKKALVSSGMAAVELENLRRDKKEGWLQLRMEERGRRVEDEQGGVVVIDLRPRENIVAGLEGLVWLVT